MRQNQPVRRDVPLARLYGRIVFVCTIIFMRQNQPVRRDAPFFLIFLRRAVGASLRSHSIYMYIIFMRQKTYS